MEKARQFRSLLLCAVLLAASGSPLAAEATDAARGDLLKLYEASIRNNRWEEALAPARQLLDLVKAENGDDSLQTAEALLRLGGVHYQLKDYPNAEEAFVSVMRIREQQGGPLDKTLEEPLSGLGMTLAAEGRHTDAAQILERALLISQRQNGLFDVSQSGLRLQLANNLMQSGRAIEANQHIRNLLQSAETGYGKEDLRLAEIQDVAGDWYSRWGHFAAARDLYRRAIEIVTAKSSENDPRLVNPLRSLGRSFIRELLFINAGILRVPSSGNRLLSRDRLPDEGEEAMVRAVRIMETTTPRNPAELRAALVDSGDWYLLKGNWDKALDYYGRALEQPAVTTAETAADGEPLSYPSMLDYEQPLTARRYFERERSPDKIIERKLTLEFTVSSTGKVVAPQIVDSDATERMEREALASIRDALYRPRFENGVPVDTLNVRFQQTFRDLKN